MKTTCDYKLGGTKSFRRASKQLLVKKFVLNGKTVSKGYGGNIQNIEKGAREMYHPNGFSPALTEKCQFWLKTGDTDVFTEEELRRLRCFAQCDQAGAEALIVAYLCEPGDYRQLFIHNVKPHVYVAMKLFKDVWTRKLKQSGGLIEDFNIDTIASTSIANLKLNPFWKDLDTLIKSSDNWPLTERYYYLAKQTVHSANYGIMAPTFRMNILDKSGGKIVISKEDSEKFLLVYRSLFPEIPDWNEQIKRTVQMTRMLFNLHGHPYTITDYHLEDSTMKEYIAWVPQSTVGEITRIAFSALQEYIEQEKKPWDILQDNHDSYMQQFPIIHVRDAVKKQQEYMNQKLQSPVDGAIFYMKSEVNIGFNWSPYKQSNPLGLQSPIWLN